MVDSQALWIITDRQINARFSNRSPFILNTFFLTYVKNVLSEWILFFSLFLYIKFCSPDLDVKEPKLGRITCFFNEEFYQSWSSSFALNFLILEAIEFKIFKLMSNLQKGFWMFIIFVSYTVVWGVTTYLAFIMS